MKVARSLALAFTAWLAVVAVGSTLVWAVISRAGQEIGATSQPGVAASELTTHPPVSTRSRPSPTVSASADPSGSTSGTPGTTSGDPTTSDPTGPDAGTSPPPPTAPPPPPPPPAAPVAQRRSWQGSAGVVVAECRGTTMSLVSAQPEAGYAVDVGERGPVRLQVEFEGREDRAGRHTHFVATCAAGVPRFDVTTEGGEGNDD